MILKLIVFVVAVARVLVYFILKKEKEIVGMYSLVSLVSQIWIQTVVLL